MYLVFTNQSIENKHFVNFMSTYNPTATTSLSILQLSLLKLFMFPCISIHYRYQ